MEVSAGTTPGREETPGAEGQGGRARILIVDDEPMALETLADLVTALGHEPVRAADGTQALQQVRSDIDLVLLDAGLPGMNGFQVAAAIRESSDIADLPIIMVTAWDTREDRLRAVQAGANDFIGKPADVTEVRVRVASQLAAKAARDALKRHQALLESMVQERTAALERALAETRQAQRKTESAHIDTLDRLAMAAEYRDRATAAHLHRISHYCTGIGRGLGLPLQQIETLRLASRMHDVGKIGVPDSVLLKSGKLSPDEWRLMQEHTLIGERLLGGSPSELLQAGACIARSHHERWDGSGYPDGLAGEAIPLFARICAVADMFDAMTTDRPYRDAISVQQTCETLRDSAGSHLDPRLVDLFLAILPGMFGVKQAPQQRTANVLVVEDDADMGELMRRTLESRGHSTRVVSTGAAALELPGSEVPDIVLLDLSLPDMDGYEVARLLQTRPETREVPFVFVSGTADVDRRVAGLALGASDFITKPFHAEELAARVAVALRGKWQTDELKATNSQLTTLTWTDDLTKVSNRRYLDQRCEDEVKRAVEWNSRLACLMVDIDHFKGVNDRYGHPAGDHVLRSVARMLEDLTRASDLVGRYGGEEFTVIAPGTDMATALALGERIRSHVAAQAITVGDVAITVTLSIGVAQLEMGGTAQSLIAAADQALYAAKAGGRNRVVAAPLRGDPVGA